MFGLSHLFYPWGFLVQIFAIVHFVRRRPENYWFYVIFFGGWLGAAVYIVAEMLPDLGFFAVCSRDLAGGRAFKP
jgi:hypothetical protein